MQQTFTIMAKDIGGNTVPYGGNEFRVKIASEKPSKGLLDGLLEQHTQVQSDVRDQKDGTYKLIFTPELATTYNLEINMLHPKEGTWNPIKTSPFPFTVKPGEWSGVGRYPPAVNRCVVQVPCGHPSVRSAARRASGTTCMVTRLRRLPPAKIAMGIFSVRSTETLRRGPYLERMRRHRCHVGSTTCKMAPSRYRPYNSTAVDVR
jgi:hypothetical protein